MNKHASARISCSLYFFSVLSLLAHDLKKKKKNLMLLIVVFGSSEKLPATRGYSNSGLDVLAQTVLKPYLQQVVSHTAEQTFF